MMSEMSVIKGKIQYDSTYMNQLKQSNSYKQKVEWWLPGAGRKGK